MGNYNITKELMSWGLGVMLYMAVGAPRHEVLLHSVQHTMKDYENNVESMRNITLELREQLGDIIIATYQNSKTVQSVYKLF